MTTYCYSTGTRTVTSLSPTIIRSTVFQTSTITLPATGTRISPLVTTTRIPSVTSFTSQVTRRSTLYTTTCTTYQTRVSYPYYGSRRFRLPTGVIIVVVLVGLWYALFIGVGIYLICFSKTAKRERLLKKGQGGFGQPQPQPQYQQNPHPQEYTPVPQDPLYAQTNTQYPPPSNLPYGGAQQNLGPQTGYTGYQNYNAPNFGGQGAGQWNPNTPSATSFVSGTGPGYIPPGAANPMIGGSPPPGTLAYPTTPSPPPGPQGPGSDPHRMLYTPQNDRLSAAVSLVHPYQQQEQPSFSPYPTPGPGPAYAQPHQTSSQTQLSAQYKGYAEPSTMNYGGRI